MSDVSLGGAGSLGSPGVVVPGQPLVPPFGLPERAPANRVVVPFPGPPGNTGEQGPVGPPGPAFSGKAIWYGDGPPDVIVGAKPGDSYIDLTTGDVYELE